MDQLVNLKQVIRTAMDHKVQSGDDYEQNIEKSLYRIVRAIGKGINEDGTTTDAMDELIKMFLLEYKVRSFRDRAIIMRKVLNRPDLPHYGLLLEYYYAMFSKDVVDWVLANQEDVLFGRKTYSIYEVMTAWYGEIMHRMGMVFP